MMVPVSRPGKGVLVAIALAAALAAGCGTAGHPGGQSGKAAGRARNAAAASTGSARVPGGGSPAQARAFGRGLLATIALPGGTRRAGAQLRMKPAEVLGSVNLVDVARYAWVPLSLNAARVYFEHHVPRGLKESGYGTFSTGSTIVYCVSYSITAPPAGVEFDSQVLVTLQIGARGGSEVRLDAQLIWYPPRSAAEYMDPAGYGAVTVQGSVLGKPSITRTFTSRSVIATLAGVFNRMHVQSPWSGSCPGRAPGTFWVRFRATPTSPVLVAVTQDFCVGDVVTVRGKAQPELSDFDSEKALAVVSRLLGLESKSR
jgi:hypothetical protein